MAQPFPQLRGQDAMLVNHVHNELILIVAVDDAPAAALPLERAMIHGFMQIFPNGEPLLPGLMEVKTGHSWADCKWGAPMISTTLQSNDRRPRHAYTPAFQKLKPP